MKIGIFGGSFNPPHRNHKSIALDLISNGYVNEVIYVPTGNKYNKKDLIDAFDRVEMLKIMTRNNENLLVADYEVKSVLTYTYQTLDYFKNLYPNDEIYFICGTDNLKEITTWKNYEYILNNYKLLVVKRNNDNIKDILKKLNKNSIIITNIITQDTSSTKIRNRLINGEEAIDLDSEVLNYIKRRKLYSKR